MKCDVCKESLLVPGKRVQPLPPPEIVMVGPKSGQWGLYTDPEFIDEPVVKIHEQCCPDFFSMELTDKFMDKLRAEGTEEIRAELEDEMLNICKDCGGYLEDDPEPEEPCCLWCKIPDYVWSKSTKQGYIYRCDSCKRYWNSDEEEVVG